MKSLFLILLFSFWTNLLFAQGLNTKNTKQSGIEVVETDDEELIVSDDDEDFLILEDEDMGEESILAPEEQKVELKVDIETKIDTTSEKIDSVFVKSSSDTTKSIVETPKKTITKMETVVEMAEITKMDSSKMINFAGNLKGYRSPRKALLRSILFPGWGQGYAKKYYKTGIFVAIEIAFIAVVAKMSYEGKQAKEEAKVFAESNYNLEKYQEFYDNYSIFATNVYYNSAADFSIKADSAEVYFLSKTEDKFTRVPNIEMNDVYKSKFYIHGWNDAIPTQFNTTDGFVTTEFEFYDKYHLYLTGSTGKEIFGSSKNQTTYLEINKQGDKYDGIATAFGFLIVANHLVSAIDAFITAKAYNDKLLEQDSVWRHIGIDHSFAFSLDAGVNTKIGLKVKF